MKKIYLALTLPALVIFLAGCSEFWGRPLPEVKKDCRTCHSSTVLTKNTAPLNKPLSALCLECHPDRKPGLEHTVDVAPSMSVSNLPLTEGRITCATCHDPHKNRYGRMLRVKPKLLCLQCHKY